LRRILVRLQGAPMGAYFLYVTFGATLKAGQKTSKTVDLFVSEALIQMYRCDRLCFTGIDDKPVLRNVLN